MSIRNLEAAFHPRSLAVIGASERAGSVGAKLLSNILAAGFEGDVWPVNPKYTVLGGLTCYVRVGELPRPPDLAVIATPARSVPDLVAQLGACGTKAAVVLSAGITSGNGLRQQMLEAARPHTLRIIGPNTIGLFRPGLGLNASFAHLAPQSGPLALLSQSGAIATTMIDWAQARGIGFSHIVSMGDMADVDFGDCLDMLARDKDVGAVLLYLETVTNARKFMSAARALSRIKPIVAVKSGRHAGSALAATTHTGALAGADGVFGAALERAGIVRVDTLEELFVAAQVLTRLSPAEGTRTAIVTNGGGAGVMALDALLEGAIEPAQLSAATIETLDGKLPPTWSRANPVDILGDAPPARYGDVLGIVAGDPGADVVLALSCPTGLSSTLESAQVLAGLAPGGRIAGKPLLASWLGDFTGAPARACLEGAGIASFATPEQAIGAIRHLARRTRVHEMTLRVPEFGADDLVLEPEALEAIFAGVRAEGRTMLTEDEAKRVIARVGIAVPAAHFARTAQEAGEKAELLLAKAGSVVVKLVSKAISHKSGVGGVVLGLGTPRDCVMAAETIAARLEAHSPGAVPDGFSVQEMIDIPHAREVLVGSQVDPVFGPAMVFGAGGIATEIVNDVAMGLPPLDDKLAADMVTGTRISRLLDGYRNVPPANRGAIVAALIAVSRLVARFPEIESVDVNPLLVGSDRAVALDARIAISPKRDGVRGTSRMCLKPYPRGWEKTFLAHDGSAFDFRPIRPTDAGLYPAFLHRVSSEDIRLRFNVAMKDMPLDMLVRLTQIDYDREMAFVALERSTGALAGVVRYASSPDHDTAEYAILIRTDLQGRGLGWALLGHLLDFAKADGIATVTGEVYAENARMLKMCAEMGFAISPAPDQPGVMRVGIDLANRKRIRE